MKPIAAYYSAHPEMRTGLFTAGFFSDHELDTILSSLVGTFEKKSVLDLGCGDGGMAAYFFSRHDVKGYVGLDICPEAIKASARRVTDPRFEFCLWDIDDPLPGFQDPFDVVLILDVFEHLYKPQHVLSECRRILSPTGRLVIAIPNYLNIAGMNKLVWEKAPGGRKDTWAPFGGMALQEHERFVTSIGLLKDLRHAGYAIEEYFGWDVVGAFFPTIYGKAELRGFWGRHSQAYSRINRTRVLQALCRFCSMYFVVAARAPRPVGLEEGLTAH